MKIVEYVIANTDNVPALINDGWQPFGSPFVLKTGSTADGFVATVYQAMLLYKQPVPDQNLPALINMREDF